MHVQFGKRLRIDAFKNLFLCFKFDETDNINIIDSFN